MLARFWLVLMWCSTRSLNCQKFGSKTHALSYKAGASHDKPSEYAAAATTLQGFSDRVPRGHGAQSALQTLSLPESQRY